MNWRRGFSQRFFVGKRQFFAGILCVCQEKITNFRRKRSAVDRRHIYVVLPNKEKAMSGNSSCFAPFREKMVGENLQQADSQGAHELRFERLLPSRRRRSASVTGAKCGSMIRI